VRARALVNASGPWVKELLADRLGRNIDEGVKQVKGSHIVVPRTYGGEHAFIVQNDDRRIVFLIPYERDFTLIGTTDVEVHEVLERPTISAGEVDYLCRAANRYLETPISPSDVVWSFSGVRPLYDDGKTDPSSVTRDYVLTLDEAQGEAPLLSVFGGKITTYRKLAEAALEKLAPFVGPLPAPRTAEVPLPGGEVPGAEFVRFRAGLATRFPALAPTLLDALARRHGSEVPAIVGNGAVSDLGEHFGDTLYAVEVDYLIANEWATSAEDVLWRRTKCGLHMTPAQRQRVADYVEAALAPGTRRPGSTAVSSSSSAS
jgi:glycerol-3-phosphate dehydrogenase